MIVSDIVGDPLEYIASGPTVLKRSADADPMTVLQKLGAWEAIPNTARQIIERGENLPAIEVRCQCNLVIDRNQ